MKKTFTLWKSIAKKVGSFQATIFFTLLYFLIIIPIGILRKKKTKTVTSSWQKKELVQYTLEWAKKQ